jgi:ELWxxDGT repeat protein
MRAVLALSLLALAPAAAAQRLLWDINPSTTALPRRFTVEGPHAVFTATTAEHGEEPWITDGTPGGTRRLADLVAGPFGSQAFDLRIVGPSTCFLVVPGSPEATLHAVDLTTGASRRLTSIVARPVGRRGDMGAAAGRLWFAEGARAQAWVSDGTVAGTRPAVFANGMVPGSTSHFTAFAGSVWFVARQADGSSELLRGSPSGNATRGATIPSGAVTIDGASGDHLYVRVERPGQTSELRRYAADGSHTTVPPWPLLGFVGATSVHSVPVAERFDLRAIDAHGTVTNLTTGLGWTFGARVGSNAPSLLGFVAEDPAGRVGVWTTDGTTTGTILHAVLPPNFSASVDGPVLAGNRGAIVATSSDGVRLFRFPLFTSNATAVADPHFETVREIAASPTGLLIGGRTPDGGPGLYVDQPGGADPTRLARIATPTDDSTRGMFVHFQDRAWFYAHDGRAGAWWSTDGTRRRLGTIPGGPPNMRPAVVGSRLLISTFDGLIASDGTPDGTTMLVRFCDGEAYAAETWALGVYGGYAYFTDGTPAGTRRSWPLIAAGYALGAIGDRILFGGYDPQHGPEIWCSDGTQQGTRMVADIRPGPAGQAPCGVGYRQSDAARLGDRIFFSADDGIHGREPWSTDGTPQGTRMVADLVPGPASIGPQLFTRVGDVVVFFTRESGYYQPCELSVEEIWTTDGSGAQRIATRPGYLFDIQTVIGDRMFVRYVDGLLCVHTESRPARVERIFDHDIVSIVPLGDLALIVEGDATGVRSWISDGTAAGTVRWQHHGLDITPASGDAVLLAPPGRPAVAVFAAHRADVGVEPFALDLVSLTGNAVVVEHGAGCAGGGRTPPRLSAARPPRLGDSGWRVDVEGAVPSAIGVLQVSPRTGSITMPGGCELLGRFPVRIPAVTDAAGAASFTERVPNDARLVGLELAMQFVVAASPDGALFGVADASSGLRALIGR